MNDSISSRARSARALCFMLVNTDVEPANLDSTSVVKYLLSNSRFR